MYGVESRAVLRRETIVRRVRGEVAIVRRSAVHAVSAVALALVVTGCGDDGAVDDPAGGGADAAVFAACPDSIPAFEPGLAATGEDGLLGAVLLDASRFPPRKYGNDWTLALTMPDGDPLDDVEITRLETFMPVHGHYGRPAASSEPLAEPGQVRAEVHFTMRGPWEVRIGASSPTAGDDFIVFDVCVVE